MSPLECAARWRDRARRRDRRGPAACRPRHRRVCRHAFAPIMAIRRRRARARRDITVPIGTSGHLRDLAVVEALNVAQDQRLPELRRQGSDRGLQPRRIELVDQFGLRRRRTGLCSVPARQRLWRSTASRSSTATACAAILGEPENAVWRTIVSIQARALPPANPPIARNARSACFLHDVLGVDAVAGEPMRQRIGIAQMGHDHVGKPLLVIVAAHRSPPDPDSSRSAQNSRNDLIAVPSDGTPATTARS